MLHGDGWTATWQAPRPLIGEVQLRGVLFDDLVLEISTGVRGRVTRVQVITETIDTTGPGRAAVARG
ncbi:hypothetical protein [Pseudonocardia spinosispora]|uniref:hypothetical protein n=1 Tax=Pseudonocardia spinosispora TaxID=103441 RepID=UPI00041682FE|nr:hypothetical protein [Pseudonocardia spinosispora]